MSIQKNSPIVVAGWVALLVFIGWLSWDGPRLVDELLVQSDTQPPETGGKPAYEQGAIETAPAETDKTPPPVSSRADVAQRHIPDDPHAPTGPPETARSTISSATSPDGSVAQAVAAVGKDAAESAAGSRTPKERSPPDTEPQTGPVAGRLKPRAPPVDLDAAKSQAADQQAVPAERDAGKTKNASVPDRAGNDVNESDLPRRAEVSETHENVVSPAPSGHAAREGAEVVAPDPVVTSKDPSASTPAESTRHSPANNPDPATRSAPRATIEPGLQISRLEERPIKQESTVPESSALSALASLAERPRAERESEPQSISSRARRVAEQIFSSHSGTSVSTKEPAGPSNTNGGQRARADVPREPLSQQDIGEADTPPAHSSTQTSELSAKITSEVTSRIDALRRDQSEAEADRRATFGHSLTAEQVTLPLSNDRLDVVADNRLRATRNPFIRDYEYLVNNANRYDLYPHMGIRAHILDEPTEKLIAVEPNLEWIHGVRDVEALEVKGPEVRRRFRERFHERIERALTQFFPRSERRSAGQRLKFYYVVSPETGAYIANKNAAFVAAYPGDRTRIEKATVSSVLTIFNASGRSVPAYFPLGLVERTGERYRWLHGELDFSGYLAEHDVDFRALAASDRDDVFKHLDMLRRDMLKAYR